jgi:hypothetical protein
MAQVVEPLARGHRSVDGRARIAEGYSIIGAKPDAAVAAPQQSHRGGHGNRTSGFTQERHRSFIDR